MNPNHPSRPSHTDLKAAREQTADAVKRLDVLLGRTPVPASPEQEILRAIDTLRKQNKLEGDQGLVLEIVESYLKTR